MKLLHIVSKEWRGGQNHFHIGDDGNSPALCGALPATRTDLQGDQIPVPWYDRSATNAATFCVACAQALPAALERAHKEAVREAQEGT